MPMPIQKSAIRIIQSFTPSEPDKEDKKTKHVWFSPETKTESVEEKHGKSNSSHKTEQKPNIKGLRDKYFVMLEGNKKFGPSQPKTVSDSIPGVQPDTEIVRQDI